MSLQLGEMASWAILNSFAGRIGLAGHSLEIPG